MIAKTWTATLRLAVACLAGCLLWPLGATAETAKTADSFVDSIGVNVHLRYGGTPYVDEFETVEQRLGELGVRHVRDGLAPNAPALYGRIEDLASHGIKSTLILGDPQEPTAALDEMLATLKSTLAASVDAVEGPNEYSTSGDREWKPHLIAYQERLYAGIKGDPSLAALPVLGPSIVHGDQQTLGDLSPSLDFGNIHSYPEGGPPETKVGQFIERAAFNSGSKPIVATETGYTNAINWTPTGPGENKPISETAAGTYLPRLFFEYWNRGMVRTFSYELVDQYDNPARDEREQNFGLLRNDLSPKPAFTALQNTLRILGDPGPSFAPETLEYTLSAGGAPLRSALLEKRDGSFYLALWRLQSVWNPDTKEALAAAAEPVTVTLPAGIGSYAVYEPTASSLPLASGAAAAAVTVDVGPGVTILRLAPVPPVTVLQAPLPPPPPLAPTPRCVVPKLANRSLKAAKQKIRATECRLGKVTLRQGAPASGARVVTQRPRPGESVPVGTKIAIDLKPKSGHRQQNP